MSEKCSKCGEETTVMMFSTPGREETPPLCSKCFQAGMKRVLSELEKKSKKGKAHKGGE